MTELLPIFLLLVSGLLFSEVFRKFNLPYVTGLVLAGIIIGPFALDLISIDTTVTILASIGIIFLMFIAGSEVKLKSLKKMEKEVAILATMNGIIPFVVGFGIGLYLGFDFFVSLILGTVFISSSIAVIIPSLQSKNLLNKRVGRAILSSTIFEDIGSLILLSFILQSFSQKTALPLEVYIPAIVGIIVLLKIVIPKIEKWYHANKSSKDQFERELRFVFTSLIATVLLFEFIGMHAIIAGFVIGIILGDTIRGRIEDKVKTIGYGIFIPIFFIVMGVQMDVSTLLSHPSILMTSLIIGGLIGSKIVSGYLAGLMMKFSRRESIFIGVSTIPQLSTTLAAAFAAFTLGLLSQDLMSSLIILSVVTTLLAPGLIKALAPPEKNNKSKK